MSRRRDAEDELARLLSMSGGVLATYERQHGYVPGRKFAADFAWPAQRLLVEIQGGIYTGGAHGSVTGIKADIERLNLATLHGWRVLRFTPDAVLREEEQGETLELIERVLGGVADLPDFGKTTSPASADAVARPQRIREALESVLGGGDG